MWGSRAKKKVMVEMEYARKIMSEEGFGLGGDLYGQMGTDPGGDGRGWFDVLRRRGDVEDSSLAGLA